MTSRRLIVPGTQAETASVDTRPMARSRANLLWCSIIFAAWAVVVVVAELHHEFWRDEVRAMSLALDADGLLSIPATIHGEGHPALWYVLLRTSYDIFGTKVVLPLLNLFIAAAAVVIFLWRAPFSLWWKALFVLSAIAVYEYSVMARNYSIVMLLMFVYATIYTAPRRSPAWLVLVLFLLTQTHIVAMLLVPFYLLIWFGDGWRARRSGLVPHDPFAWVIAAAVVSSAGIMAAMATVYPTNNDLMVHDFPDTTRVLHAIGSAILQPGHFYCGPYDLTCSWGPWRLVEATWTALLYLAVAGLAVRPPLLLSALGGLWGTALFFQLVYAGGYRHQAIWIVFLITLYWFAFEGEARWVPAQPSKKSCFLRRSFYGAFATILFMHLGIPMVYEDIVSEVSKSRAFSELLATSTDLHNAIILAEPEWIAEAIPYYADNDIYLLREQKFGKVSTWSSRTSKLDLTLHDILVTAQDLKKSSGRPILILLEYPVTVIEPQQIREFAGTAKRMWRFSYDGDQARAFLAATRKLSLGPKATLENFEAYLLQ